MMEAPTLSVRSDLDVSDAAFTCPDLTAFRRLDKLDLDVMEQRIDPDRRVLSCCVVEPNQ